MICIYITLIGSLVILIKKHVSKRIVLRIPKSNISPQPKNDTEESIQMSSLHRTPRIIQVGLTPRNNTGDLLLLCQYSKKELNKKGAYRFFCFLSKKNVSFCYKKFGITQCKLVVNIKKWVDINKYKYVCTKMVHACWEN